jgi:hypothetical protein
MKRIADQLPPEIARQLHPDQIKNESDYWAVRDQLLPQYRDQWVGFADGRVVASGTSPVAVLHAAAAAAQHPFVICVGREQEPCRVRRVSFPYDPGYPGEALPVIAAEFRPTSGLPGVVLDHVIPDTGADATVLPWADCQVLHLTPAMGIQGLMGGVAGSSAATLAGCKRTLWAANAFSAGTFSIGSRSCSVVRSVNSSSTRDSTAGLSADRLCSGSAAMLPNRYTGLHQTG